MFNNKLQNKINELEEEKLELVKEFKLRLYNAERTRTDEIDTKNRDIKEIEYDNRMNLKAANDSKDRIISDLQYELDKVKSQIEDRVKEQVDAEVADIKEENERLKRENAVANKTVELYGSAFKELGIDVKDTKEIITMLITAVGQKNEVTVVK